MVGAAIVVSAWLVAAPTPGVQLSLTPDFDRVLSEPLLLAPKPETEYHVARWTLVGALSGAAVGTGIGFLTLHGESALGSDHRNVFVGALVGGFTGAIVGFLLAPKPPPAPAALAPPPERPQYLPPPPSEGPKTPPPYETGWLIAGIAGGASLTVPVALATQVRCSYGHQENGLSTAAAFIIPVFWSGIGALIGNGAAHDNDAAKVGVVVFDTLMVLGGAGILVSAGAACG